MFDFLAIPPKKTWDPTRDRLIKLNIQKATDQRLSREERLRACHLANRLMTHPPVDQEVSSIVSFPYSQDTSQAKLTNNAAGQVLFLLEKWWREAGFGLAEVCLAKSVFS